LQISDCGLKKEKNSRLHVNPQSEIRNPQSIWGSVPFVGVASSLGLGILASRALLHYWFAGILLAALLLIAASLIALKRNRLKTAVAAGLTSTSLAGVALGITERDVFDKDHLRSLLAGNRFPLGELVAFDACVSEEIERRPQYNLLTVELHGIRIKEQWIPAHGKALLRMPILHVEDDSLPAADLHYGDRMRGWAEWTIPRNFQNPGGNDWVESLVHRDIFLLGRIKSPRVVEVLPRDCRELWKAFLLTAREKLRTRLQYFASRNQEQEAAVLASVLIGDYSELSTATRESFQNAGTYHVLVVSGLHVGWIAWVLMNLCRLLRLPPGTTRAAAAIGILAYAGLIGFQASISRCLWMFFLYLGGQALFRAASPVNLILVSAFLLLVASPHWLFDIGFQLSFLSVMAIFQLAQPGFDRYLRPLLAPVCHAGDLARLHLESHTWPARIGRRWRAQVEIIAEAWGDRWSCAFETGLLAVSRMGASAGLLLAGMFLASVSVQIWLGPVLALYFNRLSWISPLANLAIVPLSSLVLAAGTLAALTVHTTFPGDWVYPAAGWICSLLLKTNDWIALVPQAWQRCPTPSPIWVWTLLLIIFCWCTLQLTRIWIPCCAIVLSLVWFGRGPDPSAAIHVRTHPESSLAGRSWATRPAQLRLTFLDVSQGDSIVVQYPDTSVWVLDAGGIRDPAPEGGRHAFDVGEAVVSRYLWWLWVRKLDRIVLSHPHQDHAGGIPALLKNFTVERLNYGEPLSDPTLDRLREIALERQVEFRRVSAGETALVGGVRVDFINPPADGEARSTNDNSLVLHLRFGRFSALLAGDLEREGELALLARSSSLSALLLKVAHHGSRSATLDSFLERVRPRWAVLSAGRNNPFGHPSREVLLRLVHHGARPFLTLDHGAISIATDGERYTLESFRSGVVERGILPD
jgi:competence protein ComEC